jgi:hypothetical protein
MVRVGCFSQQAFQIYKFYQIWSWDDTPINYFSKCSINGHYHALIKIQAKYFNKPEQRVC